MHISTKGRSSDSKKIPSFIIICLFIYKGAFSAVDYKVLKGINTLKVAIEDLSDYAVKIGLSEERLGTLIELKLRREGIKIIEEMPKDPNLLVKIPYIYINVNVEENAFNNYLAISECVNLYRDKFISCYAATWFIGETGIHADSSEYIASSLSELLDKFLNNWYKANPKK